ncbi:hypothetical protein KAR91_32685 [Candidatus Pacearchaeota archaeon]|nr:hypothetical protein [Candidatus Pacearchaeota archaeon]
MYQAQAHAKIKELLNDEDVKRFDFLSSELENNKEIPSQTFIDFAEELVVMLKRNEIALVLQPETIPNIILVFHRGELLG